MHARETLFLLAKHRIRVPSECQPFWLQFTVQIRSFLGLILVQTVATIQTDKDLNVSFCRHSFYFQNIINCSCAYHWCMYEIVSFDIFIICDAKIKGSGETAYTHMLQACVKPKKLLPSNLPETLSKNP